MVPAFFYTASLTPSTAHLAFSLAVLHHLHHAPPCAHTAALRAQAHADLVTFLRQRAAEVVRAGALVLSFVGRAGSGERNHGGLVGACRGALGAMVAEGVVPVPVVRAFELPKYERSVKEVREALGQIEVEWAVGERTERRERGSAWYVGAVVDWLMAVEAGYLTKEVEVVRAEEMLEWVRRTKRVFLEQHKDEEVACWFIYVMLQRK